MYTGYKNWYEKAFVGYYLQRKKIEFSLNLKSLMELRYHKNNFNPKVIFVGLGSSLRTLFHRHFYTVCTWGFVENFYQNYINFWIVKIFKFNENELNYRKIDVDVDDINFSILLTSIIYTYLLIRKYDISIK